MKEFTEPSAEVREFLLGRLPEEAAAQLEARIFADPDFAEEVRIVEYELIAAYRTGALSQQDRSHFERKYLATAAGLGEVEFEAAFSEFVRAELEKNAPTAAAHGVADAARAAGGPAPPAEERRGARRPSWLRTLFAPRPALAYSLAALLVLAAAGLWYVTTRDAARPPADAQATARRRAAEAELARMNGASGPPGGREIASAELEPARRDGGAMARLVIDGPAPDDFIKLRLALRQPAEPPYRASFFNDRGREMFEVSGLTARDGQDSPQIWLFVPASYLPPGDYRVDVSASDGRGAFEEINSYAFRVTAPR